jgi:hypothetical protein
MHTKKVLQKSRESGLEAELLFLQKKHTFFMKKLLQKKCALKSLVVLFSPFSCGGEVRRGQSGERERGGGCRGRAARGGGPCWSLA